MYCKKCGKELNDGVKFCTGCGAPVSENSDSDQSSNVEKDASAVNKNVKNIRYIIAFAAAIIVIICGIVVSVKMTMPGDGQSDTAQMTNENVATEQNLLNEYFNNSSIISDYITPCGNIAEHLLRGQNIFNGFKVIYTGTVNSVLEAEGENSFAVSIGSDYYYSNSAVTQLVACGTYENSDARLVQGDYITVIGDFSGVEMFENTDGSNAEYAVLKNCRITEDPEYPNGFNEDEVKKVITSIFGDGIDIQKDTEMGARSLDTYKFTRVIGTRMENWSFSEYGSCTVSFGGSNSEYSVIFAPDYKTYLTCTYISAPYTLKCYKIDGTELWSKEYSGHQDCAYINDRLYVYADNELHIMNPMDGSDIVNHQMYYPNRSMLIASDRILLRDYSDSTTDAVIALDLDGNMIWRADIDSGFELSDLAVSASGNELLLTYIKNDMTLYETYCRYKRINLETGEATSNFKMPNDYN